MCIHTHTHQHILYTAKVKGRYKRHEMSFKDMCETNKPHPNPSGVTTMCEKKYRTKRIRLF